MTWPEKEWEAFCGLVEEGWPGEFDDAAADSWRTLLDGTSPSDAVGALRRLLQEGRRFRPSVSELLGAVRADPSRPTFDEALVLLFGRGGALRARPTVKRWASEGERDRLCEEAAMARAATMHPLIGAFVQRQGYRRLLELRLHDPQWGEKVRADLRDAWDRHVEANDGREVAVLAAGTGREGLRQLDPIAALGSPPMPALAEGEGVAS